MRWLVFDQTHSEFMLGVVEVASLMPGLLVGLFAGALADRVVPLRMIVLMECGQMVLAFVLGLRGLAGGLSGLADGADPGTGADLRDVRAAEPAGVLLRAGRSREPFQRDRTEFGAVQRDSRRGPGTCGSRPLITGRGRLFRFERRELPGRDRRGLVDPACPAPRPLAPEPFSLRELLGGLGYLRNDRRIFAQFALVAFFGFVGMGYEAMVPAYARTVVGTGVYGYSVLLACSGIGATAGAFVVASLGGVRRKERLTIAGMVIFGACLAGAALFPTFFPPRLEQLGSAGRGVDLPPRCGLRGGALLFVVDDAHPVRGPDHLRGRIMGIWMIVYSGSVPFGALWTGRVAQSWGVSFVMGFSAVLCVVVGLLVWASGVLAPIRHVAASRSASAADANALPPESVERTAAMIASSTRLTRPPAGRNRPSRLRLRILPLSRRASTGCRPSRRCNTPRPRCATSPGCA